MTISTSLKSIPELLSAVLGLNVDSCKELHKKAGTIWNIPKRLDLQQEYGINGAEVGRLIAGLELAKRVRLEIDQRNRIKTSEDIANLFEHLNAFDHEELWLVYINDEGYVLGTEKFSQGDTESTAFPTHLIARKIIMANASAIAIVHNHPTGDVSPSDADIGSIRLIDDLMKALRVRFWDFIIVGSSTYYSCRERNQMPWQKELPKSSSGTPLSADDLLDYLVGGRP